MGPTPIPGQEKGQWKKGQSGNPAGRPPTLRGALKKLPKDARTKVELTLFKAIYCGDEKEAAEILQKTAEELGPYGFPLKIALKGLLGKNGWAVLNDILDRLWGRPKQTLQTTADIRGKMPKIIFDNTTRDFDDEEDE